MAKVKIQGHASGTGVLTVTAPNTDTDRTITLPDSTGTLLNSDGSGASLTNLPNGSQLDYSGTKTIEAVSGGALVGGTAGAKNITVESTSGSGTISLIQLKNAGESFNLEVGRTAGAFTIRDNTNGERVKLDSSGNMTLNSGNLVIGTNGKGIDFSANADSSATGASTTSELLDDYEEGTWTPTNNGGSWTVVQNTATYTKIGNLVSLQFFISVSNGAASRIEIGGMPFATSYNNYNNGSADTNTLGHVGARSQSSATYLIIKRANNNAWVNASEVSGGHIIGNIVYHI